MSEPSTEIREPPHIEPVFIRLTGRFSPILAAIPLASARLAHEARSVTMTGWAQMTGRRNSFGR
jgi:hypothetical protein